MKARAHFEQRADAAEERRAPLGGFRDARQDPEERALARAIAADDANRFAVTDVEGQIA